MGQGCVVAGVPGFYINDCGKWTVKFYTRTSGILIPLRGVDGLTACKSGWITPYGIKTARRQGRDKVPAADLHRERPGNQRRNAGAFCR